MTIEEAKQVRIVDFLAQLGHHAQYVKSDQYWYLSPLRDEQSPSFKVNDRLNEWYDFGAATGGDLVELGKYLYQTESVSEVLAYIGRHSSDMPLPKVRFQALPPRPVESEMKNLIVVPLRHHALYSYLQSRKIDADIGRMFCKEIHSWASAAKEKKIPLSIISEGLGHDSELTTRIYLASLDTAEIDRANSLILRALQKDNP